MFLVHQPAPDLNELWREKAELHAEGEGYCDCSTIFGHKFTDCFLRTLKNRDAHSCLSANSVPSVWEGLIIKNPPTLKEVWCDGTTVHRCVHAAWWKSNGTPLILLQKKCAVKQPNRKVAPVGGDLGGVGGLTQKVERADYRSSTTFV